MEDWLPEVRKSLFQVLVVNCDPRGPFKELILSLREIVLEPTLLREYWLIGTLYLNKHILLT